MARNPHSWHEFGVNFVSMNQEYQKVSLAAWLNRGMIWGCKVSINVFMFFINSTIMKFKRAMKGNSADFRWFHCWSVSWYIQYIRISSRATSNVRSKHLSCWLVVWNIFYFSVYWEESSQLTFIFFGGIETTNQFVSYLPVHSSWFDGLLPRFAVPLRECDAGAQRLGDSATLEDPRASG